MQRTRLEVNHGSLVDGTKGTVRGDQTGLISYTAPYRDYSGAAAFVTDDNGSTEMAVDASISGTPEVVYLDEPTTNWTNSALSGTWDFASTAITPQGGTESIDATATVDGSIAQMERSSSISLSGFSLFSGYVYLTTWNASRHDISLETRLAGVTIGNSVNINDYVDAGILNAWQPFVIPKEDLGLNGSTIDQLIFTTISTSGQPPNYYLDTINIEETGSTSYTFAPAAGQVFEIDTVEFTFTDNITVIEPQQIMGVSALTNGIRVRTTTDGVTRFAGGIKTFADFLGSGGNEVSRIVGAADSVVKITVPSPGVLIRLTGSLGDFYSIVIADNLSALTSFRVLVRGRLLK